MLFPVEDVMSETSWDPYDSAETTLLFLSSDPSLLGLFSLDSLSMNNVSGYGFMTVVGIILL